MDDLVGGSAETLCERIDTLRLQFTAWRWTSSTSCDCGVGERSSAAVKQEVLIKDRATIQFYTSCRGAEQIPIVLSCKHLGAIVVAADQTT